MDWQKISIIGLGLLGGSIALAIREKKLAARVVGFARRPETIKECERLRLVDLATLNLRQAVEEADLIILCTPVSQMKELSTQMLPLIKPGCTVTDVGSVKVQVVADLESLFAGGDACFVGSHPMAGAEKTGCGAARADLFQGTVCALTPTRKSGAKTVRRIEQFWEALGCKVQRMKPEIHDDLVSRSSHLPHVVAAELANYVLSPAHPPEQALMCSSGFRDTTRVASGSPEMWRDIALANRKNLARVIGVFVEDLKEFQLALEREDQKSIIEFFENAKQRRDRWVKTGSGE